jgi:hypothetical protein
VKTIRVLGVLVALAALWGVGGTRARAGEGVSVEDVVKMHESGWGDELIIKMIKTKGVGFEASVDNLNKLRAKKLSDKVLMAVIEAAGEKKPEPRPKPADPKEEPPRPPDQTQKPADPKEGPADPKVGPDFKKKPPEDPTVPKPRKKCARCGSLGIVPCPRHRETDFVIANTMKAVPACCGGVGWVRCPVCGDKASDAMIAQLKAELAARAAEWPKIDKSVGFVLFHGETRHFCMDTDLPPKKVTELANHCGNVLVKLRGVFKNRDFEFTRPATMRIVCIGKVDHYVKFTNWFGPHIKLTPEQRMRLAQSNGMTIYGRSGYSLCVRERTGKDYANYVVNGMGHVLVNHVYGYKGRMPAWLSEGFSTFCETLELGKPGVWSFSYDPKDLDVGGDWKKVIRKAVLARKTVPFETLMGKSLTEMKAIDYQQSWSLNSALIYGGPDKYQSFIKKVKSREDQTEALEKVYGQKIKQMELVWKNWAARQR